MATKTESNIEKNINDYFEKASYDELYSNDIWFTIIIFIAVFLIAIYFYIKSTLTAYRNTWEQNRCNPILMPFASIINSDKVYDNNDLEYIVHNFNECLNILTEEVSEDATKPVHSILSYIQIFFTFLNTIFIGIKGFIEYLLRLVRMFINLVENTIKTMVIQIKLFFMNINDFIGKIISLFIVIYYTLILLVRSWKLMFGVLVLGWLLSIVMPLAVAMLSTLIMLIVMIILRTIVLPIPFGIGIIIAFIITAFIIILGGGFLVALIMWGISLVIYGKFGDFINDIS